MMLWQEVCRVLPSVAIATDYLECLQFVLVLCKQHANISDRGGGPPLAPQGYCNSFCLQLPITVFFTWVTDLRSRCTCI